MSHEHAAGGDADSRPVPGDPDSISILRVRPARNVAHLRSDLVGLDARIADLFLRFVTASTAVRNDADALYAVVAEYTFLAFPQASHLVLAVRDPVSGEITPTVARSRAGAEPMIKLSTTLVERVLGEGVSVLFAPGEEEAGTSRSLVLSRIRTAVAAPLTSREEAFGVLQLDIRRPASGRFSGKDLDRLTVFAHHVSLVLDNLRLYQEQRRAFTSTIEALVHSLSLKDPDTAHHSERVRALSLLIGEEMGLAGDELEALGVAAILHDMGKQGIRDEVLLKPSRLSETERTEMSRHSELTQNVLDKIRYPAHLREVPVFAAYHHEKMNGTGPYRIPGHRIPLPARIISVADVFDALFSARVYKKPMPVEEVLALLERGRDKEWDAQVVDTVRWIAPRLLARVYGGTRSDRRAA